MIINDSQFTDSSSVSDEISIIEDVTDGIGSPNNNTGNEYGTSLPAVVTTSCHALDDRTRTGGLVTDVQDLVHTGFDHIRQNDRYEEDNNNEDGGQEVLREEEREQDSDAELRAFRHDGVRAYHSSLGRPASYHRSEGQHLGPKSDMVYSLLSILGTHNRDDMSRTLLAMSTSPESCLAMRQSGCLPLLVHLLHGTDTDEVISNGVEERATRARATAALHNIVYATRDDPICAGRQETRVLRLLEQLRNFCESVRPADGLMGEERLPFFAGPMDLHPGPAVAALMKLSFDEEHRQAICSLGGVQAIAELLQVDHEVSGNTEHLYNITMRRYACMALTNLTFGDSLNKALLCSLLPAMRAVVAQLDSPSEDLCQVAASVLRNLSWHSDLAGKRALREVGSVTALTRAAMTGVRRESTLKSVLSALWNLSSHSAENKADICAVPGALEFVVHLLASYRSPSRTLAVIENAGGILRNVSSHVAVRDDHRAALRRAGCLPTLLRHLRSPSLTVVSNACGALWNLSARCPEDQTSLLQLGAVAMLKSLVHSRHRMISMGSAAALKNLLTAAPNLPLNGIVLDGRPQLVDAPMTRSDSAVSLTALSPSSSSSSTLPGLHIRRQRALEDELNQCNLSETCENMDSPSTSPTGTMRPVDGRSCSAGFVGSNGNSLRRIQSPSPMRVPVARTGAEGAVDRVQSSGVCRSSSHGAFGQSDSSGDERSHRTRGILDRSSRQLTILQDRLTRDLPLSTAASDWSTAAGDDERSAEGLRYIHSVPMMSSFGSSCDEPLSGISGGPSPDLSPPSPHEAAGRGRRLEPGCFSGRSFLKSPAAVGRAKATTARVPGGAGDRSSRCMESSFHSARSETIHLDDLEMNSSYDALESVRSASDLEHLEGQMGVGGGVGRCRSGLGLDLRLPHCRPTPSSRLADGTEKIDESVEKLVEDEEGITDDSNVQNVHDESAVESKQEAEVSTSGVDVTLCEVSAELQDGCSPSRKLAPSVDRTGETFRPTTLFDGEELRRRLMPLTDSLSPSQSDDSNDVELITIDSCLASSPTTRTTASAQSVRDAQTRNVDGEASKNVPDSASSSLRNWPPTMSPLVVRRSVKPSGVPNVGQYSTTDSSPLDIMKESFPDMSSSVISDLMVRADSDDEMCSSRDVIRSTNLSAQSSPHRSKVVTGLQRHVEQNDINERRVTGVSESDVVDVEMTTDDIQSSMLLQSYSDDLETSFDMEAMLEENARRVVHELECSQTSAVAVTVSEVRLLDDETISLVSATYDDEDDDDDDDYIDAISTRTYDINSNSGDAAALTCASSSHRSSSDTDTDDSDTEPTPFAAVRVSVGRPRIVKPPVIDGTGTGGTNQRRANAAGDNEPKGIRGRRKALYGGPKVKVAPIQTAPAPPVIRPSSRRTGAAATAAPVTVVRPKPQLKSTTSGQSTTVAARPGQKVSEVSVPTTKPTAASTTIVNPRDTKNVRVLPATNRALPGRKPITAQPVNKTESTANGANNKAEKSTKPQGVVDSRQPLSARPTPVGRRGDGPSRQATGSGQKTSGGVTSGGNAAAAADKTSTDDADESSESRPSPPVKQRTFVKDEQPNNAVAMRDGGAGARPGRRASSAVRAPPAGGGSGGKAPETIKTDAKLSTRPTTRPNRIQQRSSSAGSERSRQGDAPAPTTRLMSTGAAGSRKLPAVPANSRSAAVGSAFKAGGTRSRNGSPSSVRSDASTGSSVGLRAGTSRVAQSAAAAGGRRQIGPKVPSTGIQQPPGRITSAGTRNGPGTAGQRPNLAGRTSGDGATSGGTGQNNSVKSTDAGIQGKSGAVNEKPAGEGARKSFGRDVPKTVQRNTYILARSSTYDKLSDIDNKSANTTVESSTDVEAAEAGTPDTHPENAKNNLSVPASTRPRQTIGSTGEIDHVQSEESTDKTTSEAVGKEDAPTTSVTRPSADEQRRSTEVVLRRVRRLVEQADQIQVRRVSPPQSLRYSARLTDNAPEQPNQAQRPPDVKVDAPVQSVRKSGEFRLHSARSEQPAADVAGATVAIVPEGQSEVPSVVSPSTRSPSTPSKPKRSPVRKFGFIGLWRRNRSGEKQDEGGQGREEVESPADETKKPVSPLKRRAISWWRRTTSSDGSREEKDAAKTRSRIPAAFGGGTPRNPRSAAVDVSAASGTTGGVGEDPTRSTTWRFFDREAAAARDGSPVDRAGSPARRAAAVVTPFSCRPTSGSASGRTSSSLMAGKSATLPEQTKTAMLIERRMRRARLTASGCEEFTGVPASVERGGVGYHKTSPESEKQRRPVADSSMQSRIKNPNNFLVTTV